MQERFLFRIWDKESQKYHNGMEVFDYMRGLLNEDKYVMEQATGLKDKNGKLIYEGDIVKQYDRHRNLLRIGWIVYNVNEMKFKIRTERNPDWNDKTDDFSFHPLKQKLKVIGNIHENPELLGDKTDE